MTSSAGSSPASLRRNAIANLFGRAGSVVVWILVTPFVLRHLGPERFGVWSLFFALSGYVASLDFGMTASTSRFVAVAVARGDRDEARRVVRRSLGLSVALGVVWMAVCVLGREQFVRIFHVPGSMRGEVQGSLALYALSLLVFSVTQVVQGALVGFQRLVQYNLFFLIGLVVNVGLLIGGLSLGGGLLAAATAVVAGHTICATLSGLATRRALRALTPGLAATGPGVTWREMLGFGGTIQLSNAFHAGHLQAGKVLLGALGRLVWVTQYELGFRVAMGLWSLPTLIQLPVIPATAHAAETGGDAALVEVYAWCCRWVFTLAAYMLGALWVLGPAIFTLWLGTPQPEPVAVARWLAIAFAISTLAGPATAVARGRGWAGLEAMNFIIALIVNVALCLVLIPRLGSSGAAMAMGGAYLVAGICFVSVFHRRLGIGSGRWLVRTALARFLPAVLAAAALARFVVHAAPATRGTAIGIVVTGGLAFTALFVAMLWPTGDPRAVWYRARVWLARLAGPRRVAS